MARKREDLGSAVEARIVALMRQGVSVDGITAQLHADGVKASRATIARRMRELSGRVAEAQAKAMREVKASSGTRRKAHDDNAPLPESPDDIPPNASLSQLDEWIAKADTAIETTAAEGNLVAMGQLLRVAASLAETRRKATPPERVDPNNSPDMIALRAEAARKWHEMIDLVADDLR